ncbi:hypothetical protein [Pseudoxanthomonas winnipegensis]|uniref:Uncharacterized protein n=1 Tax=Pseudoxanthomonas winnipegensis TaxID=2480810 RepID=A0A4Q8M637_9GAMM|nr:hypothetical protein [Pseudoxanthomonas winnipegensis]TAA42513.1 hypothetical protein EA655_10845 [Pseudoxanthomonas winnipegensis]
MPQGENLAPGQAWRIKFGAGNRNNHTAHIRALVDGDHVVYRQWSKYRQRWIYRVEPIDWFDMLDETGHLKRDASADRHEPTPTAGG